MTPITPTRQRLPAAGRHGALTLLLTLAMALPAAALDAGSRLPATVFTDQFDRTHELAECSAMVWFAPDRDSSESVTAVLTAPGNPRPDGERFCYVADISGMPALITRMFALPAMRDYGYPVMLGRTAEATAMLPRRDGQVTVIRTRDGLVERIDYAADGEALRRALGGAEPATGD
jgi:hypothetical protein